MNRQTVLLRRILAYFATPMQLREYDVLVLKNKGSACHMGFRLIEAYFLKRASRENPKPIEELRGIKVNSKNGSWVLPI